MYKLIKHPLTGEISMIQRIEDNVFFSVNAHENTDYQAYLKHIAEGGEVLPADNEQTA